MLPLILAGFGILAAGAGLGSLVAGKKEVNTSTQTTTTTSSVYSPSTQKTYSPTTTTSSVYSPQYMYAPQIAISSPNTTQTSKKEQSVAPSTTATPTVSPLLTATTSPTVSPTATTSQGGGLDLLGGEGGSLLLVGGAGLLVYWFFIRKK